MRDSPFSPYSLLLTFHSVFWCCDVPAFLEAVRVFFDTDVVDVFQKKGKEYGDEKGDCHREDADKGSLGFYLFVKVRDKRRI